MGCVVHGVAKSRTQLSDFHLDDTLTIATCASATLVSLSNKEKMPDPFSGSVLQLL